MLKVGHGIEVVLAAALAGCTGTQYPATLTPVRNSAQPSIVTDPRLNSSRPSAASPVQPATNSLNGSTRETGVARSGRTPSPGETVGLEPPINEWVSLEDLVQAEPLCRSPWELVATNGCYALHGEPGVVSLTAGSPLAYFDGFSYYLGFAPLVSSGRLFVHRVDAEKNILPLASRPEPATKTNRTIIVDPGHGGENTGTQSVLDHHYEKEFTLDWALRLRPILASNGWNVILTRTNDVDVTLAERVAVAERAAADLFVSLHFNSAFPRQDQAGIETYCLTPPGLPSTLTRDFEDDPARVFPNNGFDPQNLRYALKFHRALLEATGGADRGVRRARFMGVLRGQNRPAVLIEGGYLSHPVEARLLALPDYRQILAEAVADALASKGPIHNETAFRPGVSAATP